MSPEQEFLRMLRFVKKQLWGELFCKWLQKSLLYCLIFTFIIMIGTHLFVFYHYNLFLWSGIVVIIGYLCWSAWKIAPDYRQAASIYDQYIGEERTVTALAELNQKNTVYVYQRNDALKRMKRKKDTVIKRKKHYFHPKYLLGIVLFISLNVTAMFLPNPKMEMVTLQKKELELVEKTKKFLQENDKNKDIHDALQVLEEHKKTDDLLKELIKEREELHLEKITISEKHDLKEIIEQFQAAQLEDLANSLEQGDQEKLAGEMKRLSENKAALTSEQITALSQLASRKDSDSTSINFEDIEKQLASLLDNEMKLEELNQASDTLQQAISDLHKDMLAGNIESSVDQNTIENNTKSGEIDSSSSNVATNDTKGLSPGSDSASNGGQGGGNKGAGNKGGSSGQGQQQTSGVGGGAGLGSGSKELTIPETVDGKLTIELDKGQVEGKGPSIHKESSGPVTRGTIRSYDEVYSTYEQTYRESMERTQLPAELETAVKNYFSTIKPNAE